MSAGRGLLIRFNSQLHFTHLLLPLSPPFPFVYSSGTASRQRLSPVSSCFFAHSSGTAGKGFPHLVLFLIGAVDLLLPRTTWPGRGGFSSIRSNGGYRLSNAINAIRRYPGGKAAMMSAALLPASIHLAVLPEGPEGVGGGGL